MNGITIFFLIKKEKRKEKHIPIGSFDHNSPSVAFQSRYENGGRKTHGPRVHSSVVLPKVNTLTETPPNQEMSNIPEAPLGPSQPHPILSPKAATVISIL